MQILSVLLLRALCPLALLLFPAGALLSQAPDYTIIKTTPTCASCRIVMEPGAVLRLPHDSLSFGYTSQLFRMRDGSVLAWDLNETRMPALLDASGNFVRLLARSGNGPTEMGYVASIFAGRGDSIWVKDEDPWTWHVLTPDARYVKRVPLEPEAYDILFLPNGNSVLCCDISTPAHFGYPLHLVDRNFSILKSFGVEQRITAAEKRANNSISIRSIVADPSGAAFWVRRPTVFLLEKYDTTGRLMTKVRHEMAGWYKAATEAQPSRGPLPDKSLGMILRSNEPGILWLVYHVRNSSYIQARSLLDLGTMLGMHDVVIEAFDTRTMTVLASTRFEKVAAREISNAVDMIAVTRRVDADFYTYQLHRLRLVRR